MSTLPCPPIWPFPPPGGPIPWTPQQIAEYNRQQREQLPDTAMTDAQFAALAKLMRLRDSPSAKAARIHFVEGMRPADSARAAGCSPNAANDVIRRCRNAIALIYEAAGIQSG